MSTRDTLRVLNFSPHSTAAAGATPPVAPADACRLYYEEDADELRASINGGAWAPIATTGGGPGWTDDGTTVRLTTATDEVAIGSAVADGKVHITAEAAQTGITIDTPVPAGGFVNVGRFGSPAVAGNLMRFPTNDPALAYFLGNAEFANAPAPNNQVMNLGWNVNAQGNRIDLTEPVLRDSWESNFLTGGVRFIERHWQYTSADGATTRRMISTTVQRATHASIVDLHGQVLMQDSTGAIARFQLDDSAVANVNLFLGSNVANGAVTASFGRNNVQAIQQLTVGGANYGALMLLNANDEAVMGGGAFTLGSVLSGHLRYGSSIEVALAANQNDFNPAGGSTATGWLLDGGAADRTITGITNPGGNFGNALLLANVGTTNNIILTHEDAASLASNRFRLYNANLIVLPPGGAVWAYFRGSVSARWWVANADKNRPAEITPANLAAAGTTNDYGPAGIATAEAIRQDLDGTHTLTGLTGGRDGRVLLLFNISTVAANILTLNNEDAASAAANRFTLPDAAAATVPRGHGITLWYDGVASRWRIASRL